MDHLQAKLRVQLEQAEAVRRAQEEEAERQRAEGVREMRRRVEAMREQMQLRAAQLEKVRPIMPTRSAHAPTEHFLYTTLFLFSKETKIPKSRRPHRPPPTMVC